ncbi:MAG: endonuclease III [Nitrososphaeraceae archaeon]|nr:endonuclease III [Nitrososphaeraceae archaeon]
MVKSIGTILKKMEGKLRTLNTIPRPTALKELQREEGKDPLKILIGTILSARSRDENTTKVVHQLFLRYHDAKDLANSNIEELKLLIHSIGFYNIKANRIKQVCKILLERHGGTVPSKFEDLLELPGVGRKTANCVLVYAFNAPAMPVDIHVHRISNRIGLVETKTPEKTEEELSKIVPKKYWLDLNNIFVMYGQNICRPSNPKCGYCDLSNICKYFLSKKEI